MEHRLPCEQPPDLDAIETPDKITGRVPHLDRVRPTQPMEPGIGIDEVGGDPAMIATFISAGMHHIGETGIHADVETTYRPAQRTRDPQTRQG